MIQQAVRIVRILLGNVTFVTRDQIEELVHQILLMPGFSEIDQEQLIREIESIYSVRVEDYRIIEETERRLPWLNTKKAEISWNFWSRYRSYLQDEKNFAPDTLNKLDRLTDRILDGLFDPSVNVEIDKKGLVVGQVQSGKTSNYTGLICKAADAGFKLIIVLAGIHNNLRSQTQLRLDEGFLGFDTQHTRAFNQNNIRIGVGRINRSSVAHSLTSSLDNGDFTQQAANSSGFNFDTNEPIIAVVKKNPNVLRRLHQWLSAQGIQEDNGQRRIRNKSLLLIDDEADNASINISNDPDRRSSINNWITQIIGVFGKSGYVGYTATPFANIFIPLGEDSLFPRDFIINIPAPSNYIGPERVFGFHLVEDNEEPTTVLPFVNRIDDYTSFVHDRHRQNDQLPSTVPESLKRAIRCFILTCTIRFLRGQTNVHNSMLIHVSRFQRWQNHITDLVQNQFDYYRMGINQNDVDILEEFRTTFEEDSLGYRSYITISRQILDSPMVDIDPNINIHSWEDVLPLLNDATSRIEVRSIHGGSRDALDYYDHKDGLSVIAIGGDKLSRGLTLEGLSVSYYLRSSRMYDTLMQMGRWFGYRQGYVDLCRLFTSRELNEWFCHITHATEELREEFDYMADVAGSTPEQYALKVRTHPGVLQISATNKLRSAVTVQVTWAGRLVESYEFKKDIDIINSNLVAVKNFVATLPPIFTITNNNYLWRSITVDQVIGFLGNIRTLENLKAYDPQNLIRFINMQLSNNELTSWSVALMSKRKSSDTREFLINNDSVSIGCFLRRQDENNSDENVYYLRKSHIISPKDEFIDLSESEYERAMQLTRELRSRQNSEGEPIYPNGEIVRNQIRNSENPLLLIYLLDPVGAGMLPSTNPFVGYAISFPKSNYNAFVAYAINEQLLDRFNMEDELESPDDEED
ncbi:MAG: Z1 domain-containing protein [Bacteroidales bacterium]|nr:Z1 domain-containing protein [Bacteroidales bacterium]MDD4437827.1 Z1 domain-containing protein [Tissierellia bacterium]